MSEALDEIDLKKVRHGSNLSGSDFLDAYDALMTGGDLDDSDRQFLLSRAVLFLRSDDPDLNKFGYRIVLQHREVTGDLEPLYEVAAAKDLAPILAVIEGLQTADYLTPLAVDLIAANRVNFVLGTDGQQTVRTKGQLRLRAFTESADFAVVVAPTSYGKSEMMREQIHGALDKSTAIVVPTKSLIAQTRNALVRDPVIRESSLRVITHPELFLPDRPFVAVMTQERLFRLFQEHPDLVLDLLLVDEAHNLLSNDRRAEQASEALLTTIHRSSATRVLFFTPFMAHPDALRPVGSVRVLTSEAAHESVKVERFYYTDLANSRLFLYDQFLKRSFLTRSDLSGPEGAAVVDLSGDKNLIYLNRPRHAEEVAIDIAARLPPLPDGRAARAMRAIADHVHPQYSLIETLRRGVVFHHGGMPETVRLFVEQEFGSMGADTPRFMVCTSTLLEGVNTPADTLFVLNPIKGRREYLSPAQFRNLAGRIGRFREVFDRDRPRLDLLQPKVYVLNGSHAPRNFNAESFLGRVADVKVDASEKAANPLLADVNGSTRRAELLERLENLEPGIAASHQLQSVRRLSTAIGRSALAHGADEYDVFEYEGELDRRLDTLRAASARVETSASLVDAISTVFLQGMPLDEEKSRSLIRVRDYPQARAFYSMFIGWRADGMSLREMVGREIGFFRSQGSTKVYVGPTWGDETYDQGHRELWAIPANKSDAELATLAVAKVKEEQDFIDFYLMRYVEVLNDLELLDEGLYYRVKYGTDDNRLILCLQNGFSIELAKLVLAAYGDYVEIDLDERTVKVLHGLADAMSHNGENDILVFEAERVM